MSHPSTPLPCVAILGRPNVGKSTLFNRLAGRPLALVRDEPGVTRDWQDATVTFFGLSFRLMDTPGLLEGSEPLAKSIWEHTWTALQMADLLLFVVDARVGFLPEDKALAQLARKTGKPILVLANKCEGKSGFAGLWEASELGFGDPMPLSAAHGEGFVELADALAERLTFPEALEERVWEELPPLKIGFVGRPNVGKSTLVNHFIGSARMLAGPEAGLTRDAVEVPWRYGDRSLVLVDTAGLRKARNISDALEKMAASDTIRTINLAQVVVVVLDALQALERQDCIIAARAVEEGRIVVLALNKWDQVADPVKTLEEIQYKVERVLPQVKGIPLVPMCALTGKGTKTLMKAIFAMEENWRARTSTSQLNRFLEAALATHQPPMVNGRRIKLKYLTQVKACPPTFVLFGNQTDSLPEAYRTYLLNGLREKLGFKGVPLRLLLRTPENPFRD